MLASINMIPNLIAYRNNLAPIAELFKGLNDIFSEQQNLHPTREAELKKTKQEVMKHFVSESSRTWYQCVKKSQKTIKTKFKDSKLLVAVAGGIEPSNITSALKAGADILIVGRYITQSKDIEHSAEEFLTQIGLDMDLFRVHTE